MNIEDILNGGLTADQAIAALKDKTVLVPAWRGAKGLASEYNPEMHPVMNRSKYPDIVTKEGVECVTRVPLDFQRLAADRMTVLVTGIPVKRVYKPEDDRQKEAASCLERIYMRNYIDTVNTERCNMLFAACEVMTLWYAVGQRNSLYGFDSPLKLRCRNFSPMLGDELWPLFDEYGDMTAMSVGYRRRVGKRMVQYFDAYTATRHVKWSTENVRWEEVENEEITLGKIPAVYMWRPTPIWEKTSSLVYEMEWALSRNGNYLRQNSKPIFAVFADEMIPFGGEKAPEREFRAVAQFPKGSSAQYVTWQQAVDSLKFQHDTLRSLYFTQLQLPDWSYEKMSQIALSGESRKQLFIDAQMKAKSESGRLVECFDREMNVVKAFLKTMRPDLSDAVNALQTETQVTPFALTDEKDTISNLMTANGGKPVISQRESVEQLGWSDNVDQTLQEINEESSLQNAFGLTE